MKYLPCIAGGILGALFIMSSVVVLFKLADAPPPPEGTPAAHFMAAFGPTGYLTMVKVFELIGGVLVAIPKTRNFGLLILGHHHQHRRLPRFRDQGRRTFQSDADLHLSGRPLPAVGRPQAIRRTRRSLNLPSSLPQSVP